MFARLRTGLVAAMLLVGLCAVQVRAVADPPTVKISFRNTSSKAVMVTFTNVAHFQQFAMVVSSGETKSYTFKKNPRIVWVQVEHCLPNKEAVTVKFETRNYATIATGIGNDCQIQVHGYE